MDHQKPLVKIVPATAAHVHELGQIHVQSWRETYADQLPASYLNGLDAGKRSSMWAKIIKDLGGKSGVYLMTTSGDEKLGGFISFGEGRGDELRDYGEIYAIYLIEKFKKQGFGKRLLDVAIAKLNLAGFDKIGFWVLETNLPAIAFYTSFGAVDSGKNRSSDIGGATVTERLMILHAR